MCAVKPMKMFYFAGAFFYLLVFSEVAARCAFSATVLNRFPFILNGSAKHRHIYVDAP